MESTSVIPRLPPPKPSATRSPRSWMVLAVMVAVGALAGHLGVKFGAQLATGTVLSPGRSSGAGLLVALALPLVWLLTVAVHEFGHLVGGWATGGKFLLYIVGPFKWQRTPGGIRFAWNSRLNLGGGLASCLPLEAAKLTPRRMAVMIAGGPLASLMLAVAGLWLTAGVAGADLPGISGRVAQNLALSVTGMSLLIFAVTVFPMTAGGFKSDGRRLFELLRGDGRSEQETAMMALTTASLAGVRPADYDQGQVAQAIGLRDGSIFDLYAHLTVYQHAMDLGDASRAQALLDHVMAGEAKLIPMVRDAARCEYAWLLATHTTDAAAARAWLDSAGSVEFDPATRLRAEAAVLLAEGKPAEAAAKAREGLHAVEHKSMSPAKNLFAAEALEEVLRRAGG